MYTTRLDKIKARMFTYKDGAFLASLLCNVPVRITKEQYLACTNGTEIFISERTLDTYEDNTVLTILAHELWHIARLHTLRLGTREVSRWNIACDIVINNALDFDGYSSIKEIGGFLNYDYQGWSEEQVYDALDSKVGMDKNHQDLMPCKDPTSAKEQIEIVQRALYVNKNMGSTAVNQIQQLMDKHLTPKVNWKLALRQFMTDALSKESTWSKRSRRYPDIYMPGSEDKDNRLSHLAFFIDTSGSISQKEIDQVNTEIKTIHKRFTPQKMSLIQFDCEIMKEQTIREFDKWKPLQIVGGGGTSLVCVRNWIQKNKPTAVVIFSDLYCDPMEYIKVPILWVIVDNKNTTPSFGKSIHVEIE